MAPIPGAVRRNSGGASPAFREHEPPSLGWMLALAAALFALILPIVGPMDDHHFAERAHNHDHIYLNGVRVAHDHAYEGFALHSHQLHSHQESGPQFRQLSGWENASDVLYLAPATAGMTLSALNAPYHPAPESLRPPPPSDGRDNPLERFALSSSRTRGANIPPPLPPPIV